MDLDIIVKPFDWVIIFILVNMKNQVTFCAKLIYFQFGTCFQVFTVINDVFDTWSVQLI